MEVLTFFNFLGGEEEEEEDEQRRTASAGETLVCIGTTLLSTEAFELFGIVEVVSTGGDGANAAK